MFSVALLIVTIILALRIAPRERDQHAHIHGAGQIGLLAALALFGVDYFTSYYYATGELMSALHPYGMQDKGYIAVGVIAFANFVFGAIYMFSLGPFNEGGGSYTASMRYLWPSLSLIVAVALIQDYILTIVVSALSGGDQLLSILGQYGSSWWYHFALGAILAAITWYLTIRGRGESGQVVFTLLTIFGLLTLAMGVGLLVAHFKGIPPAAAEAAAGPVTLGQALFHLLTASMKGMVALTGLEAVSNGIQFMRDEDAGIVRWGRDHMPRLKAIWQFYSGRSGIGRFVQTSFLFYGGLTTLFLTFFAIRFNVFDGTAGRTLVGNLAFIGFGQIPGGVILFWAYQILAVLMLAAASMTALQDAQATEWRDVAIGEIPEVIIYRDKRGTFTRSVTISFAVAVLIMLLVHGQTTVAVPFYGVGVFMPITAMALSVRRHIQVHYAGRVRRWGTIAATFGAALAASVFVGQLVGKWQEGGWIALVSFSCLTLAAHLVLLSPIGYREANQITRIVHDKARVQGAMGSIVKWQAYKMQEYRFRLLIALGSFMEFYGLGRRQQALALASGGTIYNPAPPRAPGLMAASHNVVAPDKPKEQNGRKPKAAASVPVILHRPPHIVRNRILMPISSIDQGTLTALRYACSLSTDVTAVHISMDSAETEALTRLWPTWGEGLRLVILDSPHKMLLEPLLEYIQKIMAVRQPDEVVTVVVPQTIKPARWSNLLRTELAVLLRMALPYKTGIVITDVPYALDSEPERAA
jgi:hypothetical protein